MKHSDDIIYILPRKSINASLFINIRTAEGYIIPDLNLMAHPRVRHQA